MPWAGSRGTTTPALTVRGSALAVGCHTGPVEPAIRELPAQYPRKPATVIAERIGWDRSLSVLKRRVRELRRSAFRRTRSRGRRISPASGPVRSVVPARGHPAGLRADGPPAGAGDRVRVLAGDYRADAAVQAGRRPGERAPGAAVGAGKQCRGHWCGTTSRPSDAGARDEPCWGRSSPPWPACRPAR